VFFVVHAETSGHSTDSESVEEEWPMLRALIQLADLHGHRLTLEFQPQWPKYALANAESLTEMRGWEATGHEIALHHHGVSHVAWDGYTNAVGYQHREDYRGTVDDAVALLQAVSRRGGPVTAGMTDEDTDWHPDLAYATGGSGQDGGGLMSVPMLQEYRGTTVTQVFYQGYSLDRSIEASLDDIESALANAKSDEVIGFVTHPFDYVRNPESFKALFDLLAQYGVTLDTVATILDGD
ncbi:MAG TPA: hypothetical protein QGF35_00075, partial [Dehalococcoidia bacterium]|nr:hypothetical protein [Dehalococcoidia bacterium]